MKVGQRVKLLEEQNLFGKIFKKGHEFTVYGISYRGVDLIDDSGDKMDECLFIHDKLEVIKDNGEGQNS